MLLAARGGDHAVDAYLIESEDTRWDFRDEPRRAELLPLRVVGMSTNIERLLPLRRVWTWPSALVEIAPRQKPFSSSTTTGSSATRSMPNSRGSISNGSTVEPPM